MELSSPGASVLHRVQQDRMLEKISVLNHQLDAGGVHVDNAPRANVQVPDFTISHLSVRETDIRPAGLKQRVGILAQQAVVNRLASQRDGISFGFGAVSPAVEDDED